MQTYVALYLAIMNESNIIIYAVLLCDPNELSITDGFIRFTAELQPPEANYLNGGYLVGTQASYSCNEGFVLSIGNANEFCRRIFTSNVLTGAEWSVGSRSCISK